MIYSNNEPRRHGDTEFHGERQQQLAVLLPFSANLRVSVSPWFAVVVSYY